MIRGLFLSAAMAVGALAIGPATAAPMSSSNQSLISESGVQPVQYRNHCRAWHRECRDRHGRGWRYERCMRRHNCG
jgi:hypothetical protein